MRQAIATIALARPTDPGTVKDVLRPLMPEETGMKLKNFPVIESEERLNSIFVHSLEETYVKPTLFMPLRTQPADQSMPKF